MITFLLTFRTFNPNFLGV